MGRREIASPFLLARLLFWPGDAFDAGADAAEFVFDAFVAAIDVIDAVDPGGVVGYQAGENERSAGAQVGCGDRGATREEWGR